MLFLMSHGGVFHRGSKLAKSQKSVPHHLCASVTMSLKRILEYTKPSQWMLFQPCGALEQRDSLEWPKCKPAVELRAKIPHSWHKLPNLMLSNELSQANKLKKKQTISLFSNSCLNYDKMYTTACNKEISELAEAEIHGFLSHFSVGMGESLSKMLRRCILGAVLSPRFLASEGR